MTLNTKPIRIGNYFDIANNKPIFLMAGPCQMENLDHSLFIAESIKKICDKLNIPYVFKSSFDKANRTSISSKRGVGIEEGLKILEQVNKQVGIPTITDVHLPEQAKPVAEVVDILQVPAFLCRQTDLLKAISEQGKPIHVKKMQCLAPWTMESIVKKCNSFGNDKIILCERGTAFGYGTQIIDVRSLPVMAQWAPVTIDCTHAVQHPGGKVTGGNRDMAQVFASASVAVGVAGVFAEVHQDPKNAPSDSATMIELDRLEKILYRLVLLDKIAKEHPMEIRDYNIVM